MWSYHVILLFSYLVPLQPDYCRLWFLSAVKLSLTSSLDEGLPRETHREDSNELLIGNVHLFKDWQLGDNQWQKAVEHKSWDLAWQVSCVWALTAEVASVWMKKADTALSSAACIPNSLQGILEKGKSFLIPCASHYTQDHYGRDRAVCYNFYLISPLSFLPSLSEFSICCLCQQTLLQ